MLDQEINYGELPTELNEHNHSLKDIATIKVKMKYIVHFPIINFLLPFSSKKQKTVLLS